MESLHWIFVNGPLKFTLEEAHYRAMLSFSLDVLVSGEIVYGSGMDWAQLCRHVASGHTTRVLRLLRRGEHAIFTAYARIRNLRQ
jgi:hypothetical protein